ncbi:MAG: ABC transporter permease [Candidatus Eisenbacteria sp.]|nr:ABC transporter permease [Candidatus Eisenbacteria bacterium]
MVNVTHSRRALGNTLEELGRPVLSFFEDLGGAFTLIGRVLRASPGLFRTIDLTVEQMFKIGVESLPLVVVTALFTGGVAAVQAAYQFQDYVPMRYLGTVIGKSVVIELAPVLTALVVGGRVGASIAAELGTMKVTEQIDALETLAIDPVRYLVLPRFVAACIMLPVITIFADILAIGGGWAVARGSLGVDTHTFTEGLRLFFYVRDIFSGLIKALFFGMIISTMGCYYGFQAEGGAEGVGRATTRAVVSSCLSILVLDYLLASVLFRLIWT